MRIEIECIRRGGSWKGSRGQTIGMGLFHHYKEFQSLIYGKEKLWHAWNELQLAEYINNRTLGVIGAASSGKTNSAATDVLADWYCFPSETTVIICSTTKERLEDRIFGEIKKYHRIAKRNFPWLPGHLIEGRLRLVNESRMDAVDGRDFRNGIIGVPCFLSGTIVETPSGKVPIESVKVGDIVINALGKGVVTETHHRHSSHCCRVKLSDGRIIDCTFDHPIFTQDGWKNAIDLMTLDKVFSAHETMQIVQGRFRGRVSKPKILLRQLPRLFTYKNVRSMRKGISAVEAARKEPKKLRSFLLNVMRWSVGIRKPRVQTKENVVVQSLREVDAFQAQQQKVLFCKMSEQAGHISVPSMRKGFRFDSGIPIETEKSLLREILQAEGDWSTQLEAESYPNSRGDDSLENVLGFDCSFSHQDGFEEIGRERSLVSVGHRISENKAGDRNRRRSSQDSEETKERRAEDKEAGGAWVVGVEILEPRGDERYSESENGYLVHNLEVSGHPSYTANGIVVHNCKRGGDYVGLGDFIGIKNKRVRMVADELQLLPPAFIMAISNLDKNPDLKVVGLGNPKETTDALGVFCEPSEELGGWEGGIDQTPKTKTWKTQRPDGTCLQLVGSESPNLDGKLGIPLITQAAIDRDVAQYGKDSLQFTMMNQGMMPKGQGSRRVITRQLCLQNHAMDEPNWLNENRTKVAALDAAYRGVGGDRCIYMEFEFGNESRSADASSASFSPSLSSQEISKSKHQQIIALVRTMLVPVNAKIDVEAEEQIVNFVKTQCLKSGISPDRFFFESGMRTSLVSAFGRMWSPLVNPVDSGGSATDRMVSDQIQKQCKDYYSKFITEEWFSTRLIIEGGQMRGMTDTLIKEGCMREWRIVGKNRIEVETKEEMKVKSGRSPDYYDTFAVGCEGARRLGFHINNNFAKPRGKDKTETWHKAMKETADKQWKENALDHSA